MKDIQCLDLEKGENHKIPNRFLPCPLPQAQLSVGERTWLQTHTKLGAESLHAGVLME